MSEKALDIKQYIDIIRRENKAPDASGGTCDVWFFGEDDVLKRAKNNVDRSRSKTTLGDVLELWEALNTVHKQGGVCPQVKDVWKDEKTLYWTESRMPGQPMCLEDEQSIKKKYAEYNLDNVNTETDWRKFLVQDSDDAFVTQFLKDRSEMQERMLAMDIDSFNKYMHTLKLMVGTDKLMLDSFGENTMISDDQISVIDPAVITSLKRRSGIEITNKHFDPAVSIAKTLTAFATYNTEALLNIAVNVREDDHNRIIRQNRALLNRFLKDYADSVGKLKGLAPNQKNTLKHWFREATESDECYNQFVRKQHIK